MKAALLQFNGSPTTALELGGHWIDTSRAWVDYNRHVEGNEAAPLKDVGDLIRAGLMTRSGYRRLVEFTQRHGRVDDYVLPDGLPYLQPHTPGKVLATGRNYAAHAAELGNAIPEEPLFFDKFPSTCIGPEEAIVLPGWCGKISFEGEITIVIGKTGRNITEADAQEYVAGYTLVNDVTARDLQDVDKKRGYPWTRAKNFDTFCPFGPTIVFRDAFTWPLVTDIETRLNGEIRQQSSTSYFLFSIARVVSEISRYITLHPGDLIATGTPEGVGILSPGDVVEISNSLIGTLRNTAAAE
jgi:2-keto-4-pentenoate hydratase/2-oxohepta-3-ene-1,7-dioic acid hydratase in catechol pathway